MRNLILIPALVIGNVLAEVTETEESLSPSSARFWGQILAIVFLIMLSGIVAGKINKDDNKLYCSYW
jgi:hypothetical protein